MIVAGCIARDDVRERQGRVVGELLLELSHPALEHVSRTGTAADGICDRVKGAVDAAKHGCPVGNDHGYHQILDRRSRQRLQIASTKRRLIEADQEANQQDRECDVRDRRDDRSAVDPGQRGVQKLLEIKHGYWTPGCKTWLPVV